MEETINRAKCYIKGEESNMEKRSLDPKEKAQYRHEGFRPIKEHHKHGSRERSKIKLSRRPYDNFTENFTPLNTKCADILREVYHLKLISEPTYPKRVNKVLGRDEEVWYTYHHLRGHHTEYCHQLKRKFEILIQRGWLLSYVKEAE